MNKHTKQNHAFTLIELLVVIAIIGILASVVLSSLNTARAKARDAKRVAMIKQVQIALDLYYDKYGQYPDSDYQGAGTWDTPGDGDFIQNLTNEGLIGEIKDPSINNHSGNYRYFRYDNLYSQAVGCDPRRGYFYVIQISDFETWPKHGVVSPGFSCANRDWGSEVPHGYAVGKYEN